MFNVFSRLIDINILKYNTYGPESGYGSGYGYGDCRYKIGCGFGYSDDYGGGYGDGSLHGYGDEYVDYKGDGKIEDKDLTIK